MKPGLPLNRAGITLFVFRLMFLTDATYSGFVRCWPFARYCAAARAWSLTGRSGRSLRRITSTGLWVHGLTHENLWFAGPQIHRIPRLKR